MSKIIDEFENEHAFLSNFHPAPLIFDDIHYLNSEAAYQAQKCPDRAAEFAALEPMESKRLGRKVTMREDWDIVKQPIMLRIVRAKFQQNPALAEKLLATEDATLIEGNYWKDVYWGVCDGVGENHLGKILMQVRKELREN